LLRLRDILINRIIEMRNFIICLLFALFLIPQCALSNDNFIYSIDVRRNETPENNVVLDIKSDYKTQYKTKTDEAGRQYFDIKDTGLKENFSIRYDSADGGTNGVESVIAQQIGSKVRIYIKGENTEGATINFNNIEAQAYPDKSAGWALVVFALTIFCVMSSFKRKAKRLNAKAEFIRNTASKNVYEELMEKKNSPKNSSLGLHDNRNLTINNIHKREKTAGISAAGSFPRTGNFRGGRPSNRGIKIAM